MKNIPEIPAEAKEIIKHKRTGKIYESKEAFDADVVDLDHYRLWAKSTGKIQ